MTFTLVTGAGGPAAIGFLRALPSTDQLVMADMDPCAAGLYLVPADRRVLLPAGADPAFVETLLAVCIQRGIQRVVPTVDAELLPIARARSRFEAHGVELLLAPLEALERCIDKLALHQVCRDVLPCPETALAGEAAPSAGPWILKPRSGSGSRGIRRLDSLDELEASDDWLVQELLPGAEYSVDVLIAADGQVLAAVPRERLKVDSGVAVAARTVVDPELQELAGRAALAVGIRGVANVQLKRDRQGRPRLLEINPRLAGTMELTVLAGANLPALWVELAEGRTVTPPQWRETAIVRTLVSHEVDPSVFEPAAEQVA